EKLTGMILKAQGDGDYEAVKTWIANEGVVKSELQQDLNRLTKANIPVDIYFKMGPEMLGL
ncbi:MAG: hypothetical protein PWQ54_1973, partial [Bacteroidales bacterium]|nr:hypothetical protein [Bacteroidales bacterium]